MKDFFLLLKETFFRWKDDNAQLWCASLAYYTVFSLAPLLLITISIAGLVLGRSNVQYQIYSQLNGLIGQNGTQLISTMIQHSSKTSTNIFAAVVGFLTLLLGASGVFGQLKQSLNHIWRVKTNPRSGLWGIVRDRLVNFSMLLVIGFLLLISLVASAAITVITSFFNHILPLPGFALEIMNFVVSLIIISILFASIFKILPDIKIRWKYVWPGAITTSLLFTIGKTLIGLYIGNSSMTSTYGAAASLAILLVWVYYAAQILFFGAEFTKAYALHYGYTITPSEFAVKADKPTQEAKAGKVIVRPKKEIIPALAGYALAGLLYAIFRKKTSYSGNK